MNKKYEFPEHELRLSEGLRALAHPARVHIIKELAKRRDCVEGEILPVPPLTANTVSQHLLDLKKSGFIRGQIMGKKSAYCLDWEFLENFEEELREFFDVLMSLKANEQQEDCA